ncbi:fumarylacetoacetate hydrolase family protein [Streptomyces blattellae]|uniref:fumarylacetoacetate hydrolase family protein n=1 Tax=Streptomyces blattellae TaxID=2569855 RepID=UPI0018ACC15A|nr:fumarylacetoacetate hydrolase family protein [Streptomyces blattellae]
MPEILVGQTPEGVVRIEGSRALRLDTGGATLGEMIARGEAGRLETLPSHSEAEASGLRWLAPVSSSGNVIIVGLNYADHAAEIGATSPVHPRFFVVAGSAIADPGAGIVLPEVAPDQVDYEGELAVVIGATASCVERSEAWRYIAGLTIGNDVSARDVQLGRHPMTQGGNVGLGKSFATFKPLGPALLLTNGREPEGPFTVETRVDGELRQSGSTEALFFDIPALVSTISRFCRLDPGDVILTGTPAGVGEAQGRYLRAGQRVEVSIQRIGTLTNVVVNP